MTLYRTIFEDVEAVAPPYKVLSLAVVDDVAFLQIAFHIEDFASTREEVLKADLEGVPEGDDIRSQSQHTAQIAVDAQSLLEALYAHSESQERDRVRRAKAKKGPENA